MSGRTISAGAARARWAVALPALRAAALPFVVSRAIVLFALGVARFVVDNFGLSSASARGAAHAGLLSWDASWYERIAAYGYWAAWARGASFLPAASAAGEGVRRPARDDAGHLARSWWRTWRRWRLWLCLYHLVMFELGDEACARRAVWLLALAPPAFVLVMGYAEPLLLLDVARRLPGISRAPIRARHLCRLSRRALPAPRRAAGHSRCDRGGGELVVPLAAASASPASPR